MPETNTALTTARDYYNSDDADNFYFTVWGGEDIHVGLYQSPDEPIADASRRTVERMVDKLNLDKDSRVLDVGAGYGGSMRYIADSVGCQCVALNLSEVENQRDRRMNEQCGLDSLIDVVESDFADLPYDENTFDAAWSQDAILHAGDRTKVLAEVARVLKPGGDFVFTDPMQADDAPTDQLQPIYDRIHLDSLASPGFYQEQAKRVGLKVIEFEDHTEQLTRHYGRVLEELSAREAEVRDAGVSQGYIDRMKVGLRHWVKGGQAGHLAWGIFHFQK